MHLTYSFHLLVNLTVANLGIEISTSRSFSPERAVFVTYQLCPPHLRKIIEDAVKSFNNAWLLPSEEGEVFSATSHPAQTDQRTATDGRHDATDARRLIAQCLCGSGKSQLVLNYVREYREDHSTIF